MQRLAIAALCSALSASWGATASEQALHYGAGTLHGVPACCSWAARNAIWELTNAISHWGLQLVTSITTWPMFTGRTGRQSHHQFCLDSPSPRLEVVLEWH